MGIKRLIGRKKKKPAPAERQCKNEDCKRPFKPDLSRRLYCSKECRPKDTRWLPNPETATLADVAAVLVPYFEKCERIPRPRRKGIIEEIGWR